ncbi:MAG: hypothetical protein HY901_27135 [Deltaproteobacteria bacterium]|nr:hypothetical protein [Deltaproteobacteria bacterium]
MRDPQAIADDWIAHMFGRAAAPQVKEFYAAVELSVRKTGKPYSETPITQVPGLYDRAELDRAKALLATALASTTEGSPERARLQKVQDTFLYGYDMITCLEKAAESSAHCTIADVQAGQPALGPAIAAGTTALTHDSTAEATEFIEQLGQRKLLGVCEATGFGATESKGGRQCLNSDETGLGDGINGWATVSVPIPNPNANGTLTMMVWGTSDLSAVSVNTSGGTWTRITPTRPVSGTAQWETLTFPIPAAAMAKGVTKQTIGFGGADSQIWVASIRTAQ